MDAIVIENLTKTFGSLKAVNNVSLTIPEGELFGLLGPNGAGKTTIINMLITLLRPSEGTVRIAGFSLATEQDEIRRKIGIIFQDPSLDRDLTGRENLDFHAMMYGMLKEKREERIAEVLEVVDLAGKADIIVDRYSGGMKRRLEIARGLVHEPRILFLDEPTLGLDAQTRRKIWEYIRNLNRKYGITVILTTHYMEEADYLCDRIAIIDHGEIIALDSPKNLKSGIGGDILILECTEKDVDRLIFFMQDLQDVSRVIADGRQVSVVLPDAERRLPEIIALVQSQNIALTLASVKKPSLEEVFISYTGTTIREENGFPSQKIRSVTLKERRR